jgi:hypothetical protein
VVPYKQQTPVSPGATVTAIPAAFLLGQLVIFTSPTHYTVIVSTAIQEVGSIVRCTFRFVNTEDDVQVKKKGKGGDDDDNDDDDDTANDNNPTLASVGVWKRPENISPQSAGSQPQTCSSRRSSRKSQNSSQAALLSNFMLGFDNTGYSCVGFYNNGYVHNGGTKAVINNLVEFGDGDEVILEVNYLNRTVVYTVGDEVQPCVLQNIPDNLYFAVCYVFFFLCFFFFFFK